MNALIQKLETAVLRRNPGLAQLLQPGLTPAQIQKALKRGGIQGAIEPMVELYAWRNGTQLQGAGAAFDAAYKGGLVPPRTIPMTEPEKEFMRAIGVKRDSHPEHYHLMGLKNAISLAEGFKSKAQQSPAIGGALKRCFPFLWETGRGSAYLALDMEASSGNRVVRVETMETRDKHPVREAYDTFEDFLKDAIQCNENNQPLACLGVETKPIVIIHTPVAASAPVIAADSKKIPATENTLALRTDFSDESAWKKLCAAIQDSDEDFRANVDFISDAKFDSVTAEQLPSLLADDSKTFAFIIDRVALSNPEHPILVVDLHDEPGRTFRVVRSELWAVENNLSIGNMGFEEFVDATDEDGIFRGLE